MPLPPIAILAGGLATRLRPVTSQTPKAMLPVAGRPFIAWQLELLKRQGIKQVVLCLGFLGSQIKDYVGQGRKFGLRVDYSWERNGLLGTGGAIRRALPLLGETFFVIYGDSYLPIDFQALHEFFAGHDKTGLMTVIRNQDRWDKSNVLFTRGKILRYDKIAPDPRMQHIDYGLGLLRSRAVEREKSGRNFDLAQVYQRLLQEKELLAFEVKKRFYEIGSPAGLEELNAYLRRGK